MYDIVIIGGGPGGYVAAIRAAQLGAKVAVIEKERLGGTCLNRGCIPTKALIAGAALKKSLEKATAFGISTGELKVDYAALSSRKDTVVDRLVKGIQFLFKKNKIELINGTGSLISSDRVAVELSEGSTEELSAKAIILATGSEPALDDSLGYNGRTVVTSTEAINWKDIPNHLLIIGGGYIGCEFACLYRALGSRVTVLEALPSILPMADTEIANKMSGILKKQGVEIHTGVHVNAIKEKKEQVAALLNSGLEVPADRALISIGRHLNTGGLRLKELGIKLGQKGEVIVNDFLQTNLQGVYAIGDITGKIQLAHVASAQGIAAVKNILGSPAPIDYQTVPYCIYTYPEIAGVGLTSQEATARSLKIKIGKFPFLASGMAVTIGETEGMVKIIAEEANGRIIGAHIIGAHATGLIAELALAIKHNLTTRQLAETIHAHPTLSEAVSEAAEAVEGLSIHF